MKHLVALVISLICFVKICIYTFVSYFHLFGLMVILVHRFITYLTYLSNIWVYVVAKDKMFSIDGGMI